jgi:hypothetical protein
MSFPPAGDQWEKRFPTNTDMLAEFGVEGQFDENVASYTYDFVTPQNGARLSVTFRYPYPFVHVTMWISDQEVFDIDIEDVDPIRITKERGSTYLAVTFAEKRHLPKMWVTVEPRFAIRWGSFLS